MKKLLSTMYLIYEKKLTPGSVLGYPNLTEILRVTDQVEGGGGVFKWGLPVIQLYERPRAP